MTTGVLTLAPAQVRRLLEIEEASFPHPWTPADFERMGQSQDALKVGLWRGQVLAGYAIGVVEAPRGFHLVSLAVDGSYRRQGWGTRLLAAILDRARQRGCLLCRLEVRRSNRAALQLYRKAGFEVVGLRRRFYTGPVEDAWLLSRRLHEGGADAALRRE